MDRGVSFTPGQPPRPTEEPRDSFLEAPRPQFVSEPPLLTAPAQPVRPLFSRKLKGLFVFAFLLVLITSVLTGVAVRDVVQGAVLTQSAIHEAQEARFDLPRVRVALLDARTGLTRMDRGLSRLSYLKLVPGVSDQLQAGERATSAALHTVQVLLDSFSVAEDVFANIDGTSEFFTTGVGDMRPYADLSVEEKERFLWALYKARGDIHAMRVRLALAQDDLLRLQSLPAHPLILEAVDPLQVLLPQLITSLSLLEPITQLLPTLGGLQGEKHILVAYLDPATLRPGGGTLMWYSDLTVSRGEITTVTAFSAQSLDALAATAGYTVPVPTPLSEYAGASSWLLRDAAWSVHGPETARVIVALLRQEASYLGVSSSEPDAVLLLTPDTFKRLLSFVGSVQIDGVTYTSKNADQLLATTLGSPEVFARVMTSLFDRLFSISPSRWLDVPELVATTFTAKEIALTSTDAAIASVAADASWDAAFVPVLGTDAFAVVDANMSTVSDALVERAVHYSFVPYEGIYRVTARVTYEHLGEVGLYENYVQVYVPPESSLVSASGFMMHDTASTVQGFAAPVVVGSDLGFTTYSGFFSLEPGQTHTLTYVYDMDPSVTAAIFQGEYRLNVFKQLGSGESLLTLNLDFGTTVTTATPAEDPAEYFNTSYVVERPLSEDQHFSVRLNR